jgi:hypothetical protein
MERTLAEVCDDPIGAKEEIMAAWYASLEECGMSVYREPKLVSSHRLDFSSLVDEGEAWDNS